MKPWRLRRDEQARAERLGAWGAVVTAAFAAARAMVRTVWGCWLLAFGFFLLHMAERDFSNFGAVLIANVVFLEAIFVHGVYLLVLTLAVVFRPDLKVPIFFGSALAPARNSPLSVWAGVIVGFALVLAAVGPLLGHAIR